MKHLRKDVLATLALKFSLLALLWYCCIAPMKQPKVQPKEMAAQLIQPSTP